MIRIKTPSQIEGIRRSCQLAALTLRHLSNYVSPGINTQKLNQIAHQFITDHGATPAPLHYNDYPKSICTSINDVVCHGIPSTKEILRAGDIINIDITTVLDGFFGDTSATFPVGNISPVAQKLIATTRQCLDLSIRSLKPGKSLNQCVGQIIEPFVKEQGFSVVRDLGGHGVGLEFHEDPFVYHYDTQGSPDTILKPGMTFTIEPMINSSPDWRITIDRKDGWTVRTKDSSLSAQFEHTVLITKTGHEVLTKI